MMTYKHGNHTQASARSLEYLEQILRYLEKTALFLKILRQNAFLFRELSDIHMQCYYTCAIIIMFPWQWQWSQYESNSMWLKWRSWAILPHRHSIQIVQLLSLVLSILYYGSRGLHYMSTPEGFLKHHKSISFGRVAPMANKPQSPTNIVTKVSYINTQVGQIL